jgi:hypothetical protein
MLPVRTRPRPKRAAAHVHPLVDTSVAATPNGRTKVIAASGRWNVALMYGHAIPNMASGSAMAKKASKARMVSMDRGAASEGVGTTARAVAGPGGSSGIGGADESAELPHRSGSGTPG